MRDGPRRFPQNYSCSAVLRCRLASQPSFRVRVCHPLRTHFPEGSATLTVSARRRSYNPGCGRETAPVWAAARSLATTCAIIVIFSSSGYLDVSVPRVRPPPHRRCGGIAPAGFPHSDIRGSRGICPSPRLFAACHVLLRLREPQASPMRPCRLSLVFLSFNGTLSARLPSTRGRRRGRAFSTSVVVARFLFQLDFSLRFSRYAATHADPRKGRGGASRSLLFAFPTCQ